VELADESEAWMENGRAISARVGSWSSVGLLFSRFPRLFHQRPCAHTQRLGCGRSLRPRSSAARSAGSSIALLRAPQRFGPWGARKWSLPPDACEAQTQSNRDCGRGPQLYLECHTPRPSAVEPSGPKPSVAPRHREGGLASFAGLHTFAMCFFAHICACEARVAARDLFRRPRRTDAYVRLDVSAGVCS